MWGGCVYRVAMQRRKFLTGASTAALTAFVSTGAAAAMATNGPDKGVVPASCDCEGTYDECCGIDGECECYMK